MFATATAHKTYEGCAGTPGDESFNAFGEAISALPEGCGGVPPYSREGGYAPAGSALGRYVHTDGEPDRYEFS
jgi:hypothetical protein